MLNFNGKTYARNDAEFTGSLFRPGNTCHGFYKQTKGGFRLYDIQKNLRAYIVHNPRQGYFTVSAYMTDKGPRYMFALTSTDETWLGLDGMGYADELEAARNAKVIE
jgi:hypothetical protein